MNGKNGADLSKAVGVRRSFIGFIGFFLGAVVGIWLSLAIGLRVAGYLLPPTTMAGAGALGLLLIPFGLGIGGVAGAKILPKILK